MLDGFGLQVGGEGHVLTLRERPAPGQ
jgi:hypothetical protein